MPADADEIPGVVREKLEQLDVQRHKLSTYGEVLELDGKSIAQQMQSLEAARGEWPTSYVEELLGKMEKVNVPYALAQRALDADDWRAAKFFLDKAANEAAHADLADQLRDALAALNDRLAEMHREFLAPRLSHAQEWYQREGNPPTEPLAKLAAVDRATEARSRLDDLDLDFPTRANGGDIAPSAVKQGVFPWTILTDVEKETVIGLLAWVTVSVPLQADDGTALESIDLTFIPQATDVGVLDPFWISETEVTVEQYVAVMGGPPGNVTGESYDAMLSQPANPVAFIPAAQVHEFCGKLRARLGGGLIVRVPSQVEWVHALNGGRVGVDGYPQLYTYGPDGQAQLDPTRVNCESDEDFAFTAPGHRDGYGKYAPVGSYPPNRWLLYDMFGNVSEWVATTAGGRMQALGGSFRDPAPSRYQEYTEPVPRDQLSLYDDMGLRIVVLPAPE